MDDIHDWVWSDSGDGSVLLRGWQCSRCGHWVLDVRECPPNPSMLILPSGRVGPDAWMTCGNFAVLSIMEER